jgi:hypothetical protein
MRLALGTDTAYYTGRPVGTIWRWASEWRIRAYGSGKNVRYDLRPFARKVVDDWTGEIVEPPPLPEGARVARPLPRPPLNSPVPEGTHHGYWVARLSV